MHALYAHSQVVPKSQSILRILSSPMNNQFESWFQLSLHAMLTLKASGGGRVLAHMSKRYARDFFRLER